MFTGIIEEVGVLESVEPRAAGRLLRVAAPKVAAGLRQGDSVAVSGVCLTAVEVRPAGFAADVSAETLARSTLGGLPRGAHVNLELALSASSRLGGHIVQGHVDGPGVVLALEETGAGHWWLTVEAPPDLEPYLVYKGSIAVDGISLTVARTQGPVFSVAVIPHTYQNTALQFCRPGSRVNLETDVLAKYVAKMLASLDLHRRALSVDQLREHGY